MFNTHCYTDTHTNLSLHNLKGQCQMALTFSLHKNRSLTHFFLVPKGGKVATLFICGLNEENPQYPWKWKCWFVSYCKFKSQLKIIPFHCTIVSTLSIWSAH